MADKRTSQSSGRSGNTRTSGQKNPNTQRRRTSEPGASSTVRSRSGNARSAAPGKGAHPETKKSSAVRNGAAPKRGTASRSSTAPRKGGTSRNDIAVKKGNKPVTGNNRKRSAVKSGRKRKKWSLGKKIGVSLVVLVLVLIGAVVAYAVNKWSKIKTVELDPDSLDINKDVQIDGTGYLNVALFGLDGRATDPSMGARSDTIIIASLNRETGEIKMSSIYRDTLLQIDDEGDYNKCNAAYAFGTMYGDGEDGAGAKAAISMLNRNLDMNIEKYVSVDFAALVDVIDAVGGVYIDVTEEEIPYLNNYAVEVIENTGVDSSGSTVYRRQVMPVSDIRKAMILSGQSARER